MEEREGEWREVWDGFGVGGRLLRSVAGGGGQGRWLLGVDGRGGGFVTWAANLK